MSDPSRTTPRATPRGPGVCFENLSFERSPSPPGGRSRWGGLVDVTFDVGWNDSWGPGARGEGFCPENWDAAWIFFKYRAQKGKDEPLETKLVLFPGDSLVTFLDQEQPVARFLLAKIEQKAGPPGPAPSLQGIDEVVRTVKRGSEWTLDLRTSEMALPYRVNIKKEWDETHDVLVVSLVRRWKHAPIVEVLEVPGGTIDLDEEGTGGFLRSTANTRDVRCRRVRLRCALPDLPLDLDPHAVVEIQPLGLEMVHVPEGPFWLGEPRPSPAEEAPRNCFFDALKPETAANRAYRVESEAPIEVGPPDAKGRPREVEQLLWYSNKDDALEAGDHERIHENDSMSLLERWDGSRVPAEFPKGYQAFYVMKRQVTQGEYATFVNMLGGKHQDSYGQLVRFPWDGTGSHRGTIDLLGHTNTRVAARPGRPCNHLSWADAMAFAAWAGLRPMTELEYEKACRGPLDPVPCEFSWGLGPVPGANVIAKEILGHEEDGTEIVVGNVNIDNREVEFKGGDGGSGPVRDDAFDRRRSGQANAGAGEREARGLSYYGIAGLTGNLWELAITVGVHEGRSFRGAHGAGEVDERGEAPWRALGWPDQLGRGLSWRGGSWYTPWRRGFVAARPYGSGAPGFFLRSNDVGFRGARTARANGAKLQRGRVDQAKELIRFWQPDKLIAWLPLNRLRDDAAAATVFDMPAVSYREIREDIDEEVGRQARALLADKDLYERVAALPFRRNARILGVGDDLLGDRHSFVALLRHVLETTHDESRLGVLNAGLRNETTAQTVGRFADLLRDGFGGAPVDLVVCLAGVSDIRRPAGLDRTLLDTEQTRANLTAIRKLAEPLVPLGPRPTGEPWPRWVWVTPPRLDARFSRQMAAPEFAGDRYYTLAPASAHLSDDLDALAEAVRAVAAEHTGDALVDLHAMPSSGVVCLETHDALPLPPSWAGDTSHHHLKRYDTPHLEIDDHVRIVRALVDLLSPAGAPSPA